MDEAPSSAQLPVVIAGERACPPEDAGGVGGYEQLLWALKNPEDPEAADRLDWFGDGEFDAEAFDIDAVNRSLEAEAKIEVEVAARLVSGSAERAARSEDRLLWVLGMCER